MSIESLAEQVITADQYLLDERQADSRREYVNGRVYAMAGGSRAHSLIAGNFHAALHGQLVGRPCEVYNSDMKVRIEKANVFRYPDLSALCGPMMPYDEHEDVLCNPNVLVEVLSDSTEAYDRGDKFALYRLLDSLVDYVLVDQKKIEVEVHHRVGPGKWSSVVLNEPKDEIELKSIGCKVKLIDLYDKVIG